MKVVEWTDFEKIEIRVGTILKAEEFPEARKPAYKIWVDLGDLGTKKSSAQITANYLPAQLVGKQVICICNFPTKQIGPLLSEVLITGFPDHNGNVVLAIPDKNIPNGAKLY